MSHSSRVSLALAAVVVAAALSAETASAQGNPSAANAVNALPSPYQPVDGFLSCPRAEKSDPRPGSTSIATAAASGF